MWARPIGLSTSALRCVCRAADCPPKDSLDFGRLLRAVVRGRRARYWDIKNILDARDPRTLVRLVRSGGVDGAVRQRSAPSVMQFLHQQRLVLGATNLRAVVRELQSTGFVTLDEVAPPPWLDATDRAAFGPIVRDAE